MLTPTRMSTPAALLAMCGLAGLALAAPPPVLDYVPADAPIVITVSNIGELMADITRVNASLGDQGNPMLPMMMGMIGALPGVDPTGSMAIVVTSLDFENMDPSGVSLILPVADMDQMAQAMNGKMADGVMLLDMQGQEFALKSLGGGFAVAGQTPEEVKAFTGKAGQLAANTARLGANGSAAVSLGDISIMVNIQALRPLIEPQLDGMMQQAEMMAAGVPGAPGELPADAMKQAVQQFLSEASMGVISVSGDEGGVGLNIATQFLPETEMGGFFTGEGRAHEMLGHVPGGAYYFAGAADFTWPGFKVAVEHLNAAMAQLKEEQPEAGEMLGNLGNLDLASMLDKATGYAQVVSVNPEGMQSGLLKNSATYIASTDGAGLARMQKDATLAANGQAGGGVAMASTYEDGAATIDGVKLDSYSMSFTADQNTMTGGPSPAMMMQMFFGPSMGPAGYVGRLEGAMLQTTTQDEAFVKSAIAAAKNGGGLSADKDVAAVAQHLPSGRFIEFYLGANQLLNNVAPMLAAFGMIDAFEPLGENVPPMAVGVSGDRGGFNFGLFVPLDLVKAGAAMVPDQQPDDFGGEEDPEF